MNEKVFMTLVGLAVGAAIAFAGYSLGEVKKMKKETTEVKDTLREKLDMTVEEVKNASPIDIQETVINKAVEKAAKEEVSFRADKIGEKLNAEIREDMRAQIFAEIDDIKMHYADDVRDEMEAQVQHVTVDDIRQEVVKAAAEEAERQMQAEMSAIIKGHKKQLDDLTQIYNNISAYVKGGNN